MASAVGEGKEVVIGKGLLEASWGLVVFRCLAWHFTCLFILIFPENYTLIYAFCCMDDVSHSKIKILKGEREDESWQLLTLEAEVKKSKKI